MSVLRIALVQAASGLDPVENRGRLASLVPADADLVVLPEAFARDFGEAGSDVSAFAEPVDGPFGTEVSDVASARGCAVVAGMFEAGPDAERPFNTVLVRGRVAAEYRKIHLYDSFGYRESDRLTAGSLTPVTVRLDGAWGAFTIGLMTCYDLRFPEHARALVDAGADLIVVPAAWVAGERKVDHWRTLLRARAIENTVFVAAAGQPAPRYTGHSMVVDPLGDVLAEAGDDATVVRAEIDPEVVARARRTNPSLANRRL
ncbi:carbon-nitrogen hydrolase family protein [Nocardioides acrostichi]|uniref:Carbon-nitrogen hydrolase family protein n=1 Tax=Nocardioides acrostichi TaxID=2784339 RepID=A0A930V4L7_9ACTN|nr:carbon-nitrogen hydrolase family protein [Nocardioides acrostichi]MBF4163742.1 carbon-nitrogen hydrolase family protein [Nocardioides acrostichi]